MKKGFTLIEALVVGSVSVVLLTIVVTIMLTSTKAAKKSNLNSLVYEQADWLMVELKRNLRLADIDTINCPSGVGSSMSFNNKIDGEVTRIVCIDNGSVASESAHGKDLVASGVIMSGCVNFVSCSLPSDGYPLPIVNFNFTMVAGNSNSGRPEDYSQRNFKTSVVVRK